MGRMRKRASMPRITQRWKRKIDAQLTLLLLALYTSLCATPTPSATAVVNVGSRTCELPQMQEVSALACMVLNQEAITYGD